MRLCLALLLCACSTSRPTEDTQSDAPLHDVTLGGGAYVAVGDKGVIVVSKDGEQWSPKANGSHQKLVRVRYGGGLFVAIGEKGDVLTSQDGEQWLLRTMLPADLKALVYGKSLFVTAGEAGKLWTSTDGATWTERNTGTPWIADLAFSGSVFVGVEGGGVGAVSSTDGATWTRTPMVGMAGHCGVAFSGSSFIAFDAFGKVSRSSDAMSWSLAASLTLSKTPVLCSVSTTAFGIAFVASEGTLAVSADGTMWAPVPLQGKPPLTGAAYDTGNNEVVAVGPRGTLLRAKCTAQGCDIPRLHTITVPSKLLSDAGNAGDKACGNMSCTGTAICVSTRSCSPSATGGECTCAGSTEGSCQDFVANGINVTECGSASAEYSACCPGQIAVNGVCKTSCP